jgi:TolB protein
MAAPPSFDEPELLEPESPTGGTRRLIMVAVVGLLVVSMVFLAWVSGRGQVELVPTTPQPTVAGPIAAATAAPTTSPSIAIPSTASTARPAATGPGPGPSSPRLAVIEPDGALFTMDGAGNGIVRHGDDASTYLFPAWSPDGRQIAAIADGPAGSAIHVFDRVEGSSASSAPPTVAYDSASAPPFYLYWSPDGASVAFLTSEPDGIALRSAPADGNGAGSIVRSGSPMYWAFSGDHRLLVHSGGQGDGSFFGDVADDGAGPALEAASAGFRAPAVSADGRYRAFAVPGEPNGLSIVAASVDGAVRREVPAFGGAAFAFEPGGTALAILAATEADAGAGFPFGPLRLLDPSDGRVKTLLPGGIVAFFWSPDGETIATIGAPPPENPVVPAAASPSPAVPEAGVRVQVAFVHPATGEVEEKQVVRVADLFVSQLLPYFDQYALSHRLWSRDGQAIVLPIIGRDGSNVIAQVPANGGAPREIAPGVLAFWSP